MQKLDTEEDKLYYNAACLFFSDNLWLGINAVVNTIEYDNEHDHMIKFLDACCDYLTEELLKAKIYNEDISKLEQLSEFDYGFRILGDKHMYAGFEYVEDSYHSTRKWEDSYVDDYKLYDDSIRVKYNIDFFHERFIHLSINLYVDINRTIDSYANEGNSYSSHIVITGNKAIVKLYDKNMSKALFNLFKEYIKNEKDYVCPVSADGHLCFCRQLGICCCR